MELITNILDYSSSTIIITIAVLVSIAVYAIIPVMLGGRNWKMAPPGPVGLPIIGNLHQLSASRLHEDFFNLAKVYGPIFSLKLGQKPAIVVSSPEMAQEVLKIKEGLLSSRTITEAIRVISYDAMAVVFSPYGPRWKLLRRILITELLSPKAFKHFESVRRQEVHMMLRKFYLRSESNTQVDIAEGAFTTLANLLSNVLVSKSLFDPEKKEGRELKNDFWELIKIIGTPNCADLIPILKPFDPQGLKRRIVKIFKRLDAFYEKLIDERLKERESKSYKPGNISGKKDMLDVLLDYRSDDKENDLETLPKNIIKGMISETFIGGTETTSSTVEWGMAETIRKPEIHNKLVSELDQAIGKNRLFEESDIDNLPYLQAVVKEVFRLHPGIPLIIPRRTNEECEIAGYHLPKHCIVYVNVWGIGRDPKVWEDPLVFNPERFVGSSVDVKGQDFNLLPFGTGRRSCVGWPLAHKMVHFYLGAFLHGFDWECPGEVLNDMSEQVGLTLQKNVSLVATPKPRLSPDVYQM